VIVHTPRGTNSVLELPGGCSILDYRAPDFPVTDRIEVVGAPGLPVDAAAYMKAVQECYLADAYHSLSIEGCRVTDELIQRVATGDWNPEQHPSDADARNAMAAHGYWRAFQLVKESLRRILSGDDAGEIARADHRAWYRALFAPSVEKRASSLPRISRATGTGRCTSRTPRTSLPLEKRFAT
jgi:hypothetical protein